MQSKAVELPVADRVWAWLDANKKPVLYGCGAAVVVGVIIGFFVWHHDARETSASLALSSVAAPQFVGGQQPDTPEGYLRIVSAYPNSSAATRAGLMAAASYFTEGKYAEAKTQFERFTREHSESPFIGEALLGIAACLDAQGNTAEAAAQYKNLIDRHPNESFIPQAKFALARIYEEQNKPEQARNLYEEVESTDRYGYLGSEAGLRLEDLKQKYPNLAASVPPPPAPYRIEKK